MGGKGGGGVDTSGMEQAAQESTELQRQIYEESIARGRPFYEIGLGGARELATRLGIDTRPTRADVRAELLPQYTREVAAPAPVRDIYGTLRAGEAARLTPEQQTAREAHRLTRGLDQLSPDQQADAMRSFQERTGMSPQAYLTTFEARPAPAPVTDYGALDAAVEARLAEGAERPEYFGQLLQPFTMERFEEDPAYAFRQEQAERALARTAAAQGRTFAPRTAMELQRVSQALAGEEYGRAFERYNIEQQNIYNRLAGLLGMGQQQTAQAAQLGQQYGAGVAETVTSLAQAQAAARQAEQQRKQSMFGTLIGGLGALGGAYLGTEAGAGALSGIFRSDRNLKENIKPLHVENGFQVYEFNYKDDPEKTRYEGVMAQEVQEIMPEAVKDMGGHLGVDYSKIGFPMRRVN